MDQEFSGISAGARLDRLPIGRFHQRIRFLIGVGMFFDGFDIYIAATVLGATIRSGFATLPQGAAFVSATFLGMMLGSVVTGFLGDRLGRRFTYQTNLAIFGIASLVAAVAPSMSILIILRFVMGFGLGAENVVGYSTLTEFIPPAERGRWLGMMAVIVVTGLPASAFLGYALVPLLGWRVMFVLGGIGALFVWRLRKALPESPRWLQTVGRHAEAEALLSSIEAEASNGAPLPEPVMAPPVAVLPFSALFSPPLLGRLVLGCVALIVINTLIYGFITWLPTFMVKQGLSVAHSFGYAALMSLGAPIGSFIGAIGADRWGRKPTIIGASLLAIVFGVIYPFVRDPVFLSAIGFALTVPIYILVAMLFAIYIPELFPTEIRLRAAGIANMFGRGATIITPFMVISLFGNYGVGGVLVLMVGLLVALIIAVLSLGIETRQRRLEAIS
ncbi:MAG: MFS transporter [Acidocella sp.]|jgi:putative MFS transporter|nr:MFS transporter [Acidocella sp.]OYY05906.1 MAG: MFS transporter [Acidocella sp. 35-58-6]